jgi:hypothetical protein
MGTTKITYKEPEIFEIKEIRKDIKKNIDKYNINEIESKINIISNILYELKSLKYNINRNKKYRMKNLLILKRK